MKRLSLITALTLSALTANAAPDPGADWDWPLSENISPPRGVQVFDTKYTDINFNKVYKVAETMEISMTLKDQNPTSIRRVCE
ncbi:MAG: hypothetical protein L3J30_04375 [Marinosulfonomonas sp.]|nr:hypothetical protein [Marinosulfonomonas sp.]